MPEIVPWQREQPLLLIQRAADLIRAGKLVAFPTDTMYKVIAGLLPDAAERLQKLGGTPTGLSLAVSGETQALHWAANPGVLGRRLMRRCWPGPVTLAFPVDLQQGAVSRLDDQVRALVAADGMVRLRCPDHDALLELLRMLGAPVLLGDASAPATSA